MAVMSYGMMQPQIHLSISVYFKPRYCIHASSPVLMKALICSSLLILPSRCSLAALCPGKLKFKKLLPDQSTTFHWYSNNQDCYKNGESGNHMVTVYILMVYSTASSTVAQGSQWETVE